MTYEPRRASRPARVTRRSERQALTLIELCTVMAALTLVATVTTMLLHAMMRQQAAGGKQLLAGHSLNRLGDRFRKDVHTALGARIDRPEHITLVQPAGAVVSYAYQETGAVRRTWQDSNGARQDEFDLQTAHQISFARKNYPDARTLVILTAQPVPVDSREGDARDSPYVVSSRGATVIAELGRDHRWHRTGAAAGDFDQESPFSPADSPGNRSRTIR